MLTSSISSSYSSFRSDTKCACSALSSAIGTLSVTSTLAVTAAAAAVSSLLSPPLDQVVFDHAAADPAFDVDEELDGIASASPNTTMMMIGGCRQRLLPPQVVLLDDDDDDDYHHHQHHHHDIDKKRQTYQDGYCTSPERVQPLPPPTPTSTTTTFHRASSSSFCCSRTVMVVLVNDVRMALSRFDVFNHHHKHPVRMAKGKAERINVDEGDECYCHLSGSSGMCGDLFRLGSVVDDDDNGSDDYSRCRASHGTQSSMSESMADSLESTRQTSPTHQHCLPSSSSLSSGSSCTQASLSPTTAEWTLQVSMAASPRPLVHQQQQQHQSAIAVFPIFNRTIVGDNVLDGLPDHHHYPGDWFALIDDDGTGITPHCGDWETNSTERALIMIISQSARCRRDEHWCPPQQQHQTLIIATTIIHPSSNNAHRSTKNTEETLISPWSSSSSLFKMMSTKIFFPVHSQTLTTSTTTTSAVTSKTENHVTGSLSGQVRAIHSPACSDTRSRSRWNGPVKPSSTPKRRSPYLESSSSSLTSTGHATQVSFPLSLWFTLLVMVGVTSLVPTAATMGQSVHSGHPYQYPAKNHSVLYPEFVSSSLFHLLRLKRSESHSYALPSGRATDQRNSHISTTTTTTTKFLASLHRLHHQHHPHYQRAMVTREENAEAKNHNKERKESGPFASSLIRSGDASSVPGSPYQHSSQVYFHHAEPYGLRRMVQPVRREQETSLSTTAITTTTTSTTAAPSRPLSLAVGVLRAPNRRNIVDELENGSNGVFNTNSDHHHQQGDKHHQHTRPEHFRWAQVSAQKWPFPSGGGHSGRSKSNECPENHPSQWENHLDVASKALLAPVVLVGELISLSEDYGGRIAATFRMLKVIKISESEPRVDEEGSEEENSSHHGRPPNHVANFIPSFSSSTGNAPSHEPATMDTHVRLYFVNVPLLPMTSHANGSSAASTPPYCAHSMVNAWNRLRTKQKYLLFAHTHLISNRTIQMPVAHHHRHHYQQQASSQLSSSGQTFQTHQLLTMIAFTAPEVHNRNASRSIRKVLCKGCGKFAGGKIKRKFFLAEWAFGNKSFIKKFLRKTFSKKFIFFDH